MITHTPYPWTFWFSRNAHNDITAAGVDCGTDTTRSAGIAELVCETVELENEAYNQRILADGYLLRAAPVLEATVARILVCIQQGIDDADLAWIEQQCNAALGYTWNVTESAVGTPTLADYDMVPTYFESLR